MSNTVQHWFFKKFTAKHLLMHVGSALLLTAMTLRHLIVAGGWMSTILLVATIYYFRYIYQYWKSWDSSQGRRQYISLYEDEMEYFVAPAGQGRLKYEQIRYVYILIEDNQKHQGNHLIIEYRLPEDIETSPDLHELVFNLDFLLPPDGASKSYSFIPDLNTQTSAFEAALRQRCHHLYSLIQRESLRNHAWLEAEKEKTRQWLESFKNQ